MTACQFTSANVRYRFDLNGREASNELDVLFLALEQDHCVVDLRTNHLVPDCTSRSLIKGVASGTAVVNSADWFMWRRMPQHTDAQQQCRNILLSRTSRIDARPQLEILRRRRALQSRSDGGTDGGRSDSLHASARV